MKLSDTFIIVVYFSLLFMGIALLYNFYICDNLTCGAFTNSEDLYPKGTKNYYAELLNNVYADGFWCFPYIGASILSFLSFWFLNIPNTLYNFGFLFFVSFCVIYFTFAFLGHHHVRIINEYVAHYIINNCSDAIINPYNNYGKDITQNNSKDNTQDNQQIQNYYKPISINPNY
jgi:hypothetical protein